MLSVSYATLAVLLGAVAGPALAIPAPSPDRPTPPGPPGLVGDGSPHQNYLYKQVVEPLECGDDSCTAGQSKTFSLSVGFSVGSGGGPDNFANGGFAVSAQWSTTETDSCAGGQGDTVCLWYAVAHTAYTVEGCDELGKCSQYVMKSPNNNNLGGGFLCGKNAQCKSINTEIWNNNGPAGGPQASSGVLDPSNLN